MEIRFDHVALALSRIADATPFLTGTLGGVPAYGADSDAYRFSQWRFANNARLEALEPRGADGFLHRFLATRGPGIHHVTFKVPSLRDACERARAHGYDVVGYNDANPRWKEAFLHPKQALGIVVQLAEFAAGDSSTRRMAPSPPSNAPPPVTVVGLRMRARSRGRARTQWLEVLAGAEAEAADRSLIYTWPRSPLRIAVEIHPAREEGPICIELAGERVADVLVERHPQLGAAFRQATT